VFDRLREEIPKNLQKIHLVSGDIAADNLGLSEKDRSTLINEVSVVFHSAATVKFSDPLPITLQMNTFGTKRIVQLCKEIKQIEARINFFKQARNFHICTSSQAFVYVSTFYSNSNLKEIQEVVYTPRVDHNELQQICASLSDAGVDEKA
jgi:alcohol-forming fatty acyl-CoA reductase